MNFVEYLPTILVTTLVGGYHFPLLGVITAWAAFIGRPMYAYGYTAIGPTWRLVGATFALTPLFVLLYATVGMLVGRYVLPGVGEEICMGFVIVTCLLVFTYKVLWPILLAMLNKN